MRAPLLLLTFVSLILLGGCAGETAQPVPGVQNQPGLVSFRIDGQIWTASATISGSTGILSGLRGTERIEIRLQGTNVQTYQLTTSASGTYVGLNQYGSPARDYYSYTCSPAGGQVQVTEFDAANNQLSGKFAAIVCTPDGVRKEITEGVFNKIRVQ